MSALRSSVSTSPPSTGYVAGKRERLPHRLEQALSHRLDGSWLGEIRQQDRELVTPEASDAVRGPGHRRCGLRSGREAARG
jgi:hypothetical protein